MDKFSFFKVNRKFKPVLPHPDANVFIGDIGHLIKNEAQLASSLSGVQESDVSNFTRNYNNNISFTISVPYAVPQLGVYSHKGNPTHFIDVGGNCSQVAGGGFIGAQTCTLLYFPQCVLGGQGGKNSRNFRQCGANEIIITNAGILGGSKVENQIFFLLGSDTKVYCDPLNETCNDGGLNPDLHSVTAIFVSDFTDPNPISNLAYTSISPVTKNDLDFEFDASTSSNIYKYEVWINGHFHDWTTGAGQKNIVTNFKIETLGIVAVDTNYNRSTYSEIQII
jgi:hypothetical protein